MIITQYEFALNKLRFHDGGTVNPEKLVVSGADELCRRS